MCSVLNRSGNAHLGQATARLRLALGTPAKLTKVRPILLRWGSVLTVGSIRVLENARVTKPKPLGQWTRSETAVRRTNATW